MVILRHYPGGFAHNALVCENTVENMGIAVTFPTVAFQFGFLRQTYVHYIVADSEYVIYMIYDAQNKIWMLSGENMSDVCVVVSCWNHISNRFEK